VKIENLLNQIRKETDDFDHFFGNSFQINIAYSPIETFSQRIKLIDKATEIEHQRLLNDEDSWAIDGLNKLGNKWIEFDFEYGKEMLFNAIQYDLAYSKSKKISVYNAKALHNLIMTDYTKENTYIYSNYNKSPWERKGYSGNNLTNDWTFDIGIVLINSNKLTFNYFLSED